MFQSKSRSLSPGAGVHTRRKASSGLSNGEPRKIVLTELSRPSRGDSESSAKSTSSSSSENITNMPFRGPADPIHQPATRNPIVVVDTSQRQLNLQQENSDRTVNPIVYGSAQSLEEFPMDEGITLFNDLPRTMIVIKWMRFYKFYPGMDKSIDKPRRDELKNNLKLPHAFGQKLAGFIINKFNSFRKRGLISWDGKHHVEYHSATDVWLSRTWNGEIEGSQSSPQPEPRLPSTNSTSQKRPAPYRLQPTEKRQRTILEIGTALVVASTSTNSNDSTGKRKRPAPSPEQQADCHQQESDASNKADGTVLRKTKEAHQILPSRDILPNARGGFGESAVNPHQPNNLALHHKQLAGKLDTVRVQSTSKDVANFTQSSGEGGGLGDLPSLRDKEKVYLQALEMSMEELEGAREVNRSLCRQYDTLKAELKVTSKLLGEESRRQADAPTSNHPGVAETSFTDSIYHGLQQRTNMKFVLAKKEEKLRLERQLGENAEIRTSLKVCIKAKKMELKQLRDDIKERLRINAQSVRVKVKLDSIITEFQDVCGYYDSSSVSPVEPTAELVQCELDQLDEEDTENQIDSLLVDCTV